MDIDISADVYMFDNTVSLFLISKGTEQTIDYQAGTIINDGVEIKLDGCLIRQMSDRVHSTVRQIFQRGVAIANDNIEAVDVVIDIPNTCKIKVNDQLEERDGETVLRSWEILAIDLAALKSRWRTACRIISRI